MGKITLVRIALMVFKLIILTNSELTDKENKAVVERILGFHRRTNVFPSKDYSRQRAPRNTSVFYNEGHSEVIEDDFETDTMDWEFDEKARKDGYKLTTPEENPYSVMLVTFLAKGKPLGVCSGTLLSLHWVLSAGHCFATEDTSKFTVVKIIAGGSPRRTSCPTCQLRVVKSSYVYTHPEYEHEGYSTPFNDLSMVYVDKVFVKTEAVKPIGLARSRWPSGKYEACRLTGFGIVQLGEENDDDYKRKTSYLEVASPCQCIYQGSHTIGDFLMCSRPREDYGLCSGDSGGGLICQRKVVGIASAIKTYDDIDNCSMKGTGIKTKCGLKNTLSMFVQTYPYKSWINGYLKGGKPKPNRSAKEVCSWYIVVLLLSMLSFPHKPAY